MGKRRFERKGAVDRPPESNVKLESDFCNRSNIGTKGGGKAVSLNVREKGEKDEEESFAFWNLFFGVSGK